MTRSPRPLLLVLLAVPLTTACRDSSTTAAAAIVAPAPPLDVAVVRASTGTIQSALEVSGTLVARTRVGVKPKLPGRLERVLVNIGDRVSAGQVVATIDRGEVDAQVDAAVAAVAVANAAVETAEAGLASAVTELERARTLVDAGAMARQILDSAQTTHRAAVAQRDLARASMAQAEAAARRAREVQRDVTLYAPLSGFVVERHYDAGAIPGEQPVVVVADLRELKLEAGVSEMEAGRLKTGMAADVVVQAKPGETFAGQLAAISPEVDERNRHFRVEVRVPNRGGALLGGMFATARLVVARAENALLVPREAVTSRDGRRVVITISAERATAMPVVEGLHDGRQVQIVSGLKRGEQVMADARRQIAEGARVRAVERK